jgi:hypothetical protein
MRIRKLIVASAICGAAVAGVGAPALAGEVTGNVDYTPVNTRESDSVATPRASICAFSGLEDEAPNAGPGNVQNPKFDANGASYEPGSARACSFVNYGHSR